MDNSFSTQESQIVRRQSSLGGNNIKRTVTELEGNTALVWAKVTQVYYQKGTCDFTLLGGNTLLNDNSGSNGTYSAPIPVDYYGTNYQGKPFIKTRLVKEGNKVLVAFVDGKLANPVIVGVYPDNTEGYEYLAPAYTNKILDENEDTNNQVNNMLEVEPSNQIIYQSGNGDFAKSMQGKSFLIVQGSEQYALNDLLTNYDSLPYFYLDEESNDINSQKVPLYSVNEEAPEWLLVHESNNGTDTHRTRFYVNKKGELQIVFFDVNNPSELLVIDGSKDNGFTVNKRFDGDGNLDSDSKDYVKFNVGQDHKISMEVSSAKESKAQSQKLELKDDGLYYNGKSLLSYLDNIDSSVNDDDVKDIINSTTGVDDWDDFRDKVHQAAQDAQKAADEAKEAGDDADRAGEEAAQAGLDAKLAGENAAAKVDSMRDKLMYYLNLSPEKDLYVPGKYLILNEDVTIRSGFIKEGYIDDAAINSAAIKNAAITSAKIKDLAVYSAKIANAAITNAKISKLAVGTAQIRDLAVTDEKVGKLTFNHMVGEVLDANLIKVTNLEADSIKAHSITADKLFVGSLGEISGNLGNITGGHIDGSKVDIDGLPSDDPDMLTPEKKAQLRATVDTLQLAVNAQVDFQNSVGAPSNVCDTLKANMAKLVSDTTPLLRDMFSTEPYDHNLINTDIDNVNIELNNIQHRAITTIGKTANGKNTIYTGAFAPSNPQLGDIWAKPSTDGSNEGTFEIYGENGWFSPTVESQKQMQAQIDRMPKNYYQSDQPTGSIVEGSMWYKPSYDALGNVTFTMYVYHNGAWKAMTDANIEGVNAAIHQVAQTADGKNKVFSSDTQPNSANVHEGDLWFNTKSNSIYVYHGGTWTVPNASAQAQIDSAISKLNNNYYQANQPTGNIKNGDMWYKTITNTNGQVSYELYVYQNGNWIPYNVDAINGLEQKINQVAQTADGKNAVFASGSAPSNPVQGDIWIDTSANNTIKVYINGSWQTTESQNQKVQDQVNNALNGIPKVYYQSTQPTGTINEGSTWYKTGANNTYTMYTYKNGQWVGLLDDNINTAIDNTMNSLQQAGTNLVVNSDFSQGNYGWDLPSDGSAKVSDDLFKGHKYVTISKSNQSGTPFFWIRQKNEFKVTPGEKLSYSAWIKHTGLNPNGALLNIDWYADTTSGRNGWYSTWANSTNDSDWEFYKVEGITVPSNAQYARFSFTLPANGNVSYALPMLVHGSTVPSWAPSPADSASVSDVQGIDFGGRNLLLQSQARDNGAYYMINGAKQNETFLGANVYEQHGTWQGQEFKLQNLVDRNVINTNDEYVFSTYVKYTGKNPGSMIYFFNADNTIQILNDENGQTAFANTKPNVWNQISIHIKFNSTTPPSSGKFYAGFEYGSNNDGSVTTYWACPKLEKGSKATDYSVAPEDVDNSLSANQNAINQTNSNVTNVSNKVGQVQNSVNTANNNISSLQGNVNTINQQLKDQQNQIKGVTTINYVPNSTFVTNPQTGLAQTFQKPLLWKEFGNAQMRIAGWSGQPAFMHFYNDYGAHSVRLDLDYADCIINGWVDYSTGDTKSSSGDVNGLINRLITVVPGDTIHLENDNVEQLSTGTNNIAWYDQRYNYLCTTNIPGMSKNSAYVQDVLVPYKACYAKIGMVGIPKGTKNTWGITYKFKNMAGRGTIISNNPTEDSNHWTKVGSGSGTVTQFNNLSNAPRGAKTGMRLVTTWNNYQNTGMRTNLTGLTRGKVYMISFYAYATSGGGSIRMVTPDQSSIQIIPNTQSWYPIEFSFIASDTNQWLDLYTDAPNETIYITYINISGCDSNADMLSDKVTGMATLNNWGVQGSTVSVSDNQMLGENIIVLAPNGRTSNQMTYNNDLIENHVYVAKFWAKSDSGSNTLHMEMYGGHFDKDVNIPSGSNWTYVEFPFVYSSSTSTNTFRQNGSQRSFYLYNKGTASNVQVAGFGIYDYDSDVPKEGYFEDNRYGQIDASSAVYGATSAKDAYVRVWRNGTPSYYPATSRGTTVTEFDDTLKYVGQKAFDTYDTNNCTDLVNYLNGLNSTHIVAITTCDSNTLDSNFQTWLENHNVPINLIQSYNQQRVRMAFVGPIDRTRSSWVFPTQFALEGNYTKYQPNTFGGTVSAHLRHNQTGSSKCYKFHTYPVTPKSWVEFTWRDTPDFNNVVFLNNGTGLIQNIGSNVSNLKTVSMYALDQEAFTLTGSSWANIGAYVEPFDVAPHVSTGTIPVVTSTHTSRVQAGGSAAYSNQQAVYLEVGHDSTFDKSTKVLFNGAGKDGYSLQNYLVDGMSDDLGWAKPIRITYTPPVTGKAFNNNNSGIIYVTNTSTEMRPVVTANQMLTITQSNIDYIPAYQPNTSGLVNNSVQISQSYNGVTIDDKDGITINAGNNRISLNANVGIDIWGNSQHNMKLDTNGNLIMRGNLVAGNISGVNISGSTFSGNAMQLQTGLAISGNGAITVGNDVSISASQGLVMNKGSININNNTLITNDGTLITKKLLLNNSAQILNKESGRPVITLDNNGNATFAGNLNVVNINGNNGNLNGVLNVKGGIKSNGVYLSNSGLSISNGNVILGRDVTVLAAVGAADINGAIRSITGGWINNEGGWSGSTQDCGFRIVPIRANHQIMVMLGAVPDLSRNQMAWYDSSQHFIRRDVNADFSQNKVSGSSTMYEYLYTPPSNAAYLSFSTYVGPNNVSQDVPIYIYEDGNVNLIMTNDGTLIAQSAIISGTVTSNNVNITGGHLHLMNGNNVGLDVDSNGNASFGGNLNAVNGSMNNMNLTGTLVVNGKISAANNNVQITQNGISIANGNLTLGNGNGTTFMALSDGTLTLNNASVTGQITATKLVVATKNDKNAVGINVNGNFTVDGLGEVYANNIHLKQGNNNTPTLEGVNVVGDGLKLGDTYWNAFYQNNMSRTNYTPNGLQTGYTLEGVYVQSRYRAHHGDGLQEHKNMSIVTQLAYKGYVDGYSGREYDSNQDVRTGRIPLLNPGQQFHLHLDGNAMPYFGKGGDRNIAFFDGSGNYISGWKGGGNDITTTSPSNAKYVEISVAIGSGNVDNYFSIITGIHSNADQINMGNLTQIRTGWVDISRFRSAIMWEGNCNMGFPIISNNYGGQDISQFGTSKDNQWVTVLTLDTTGMRDGDVMVMKYTINYDNAHSEKGTTLYMSVNGKNKYDSERYMGSTNTKYTVVGEHHYVWYFTYHSDLGSQVIFNLNANKLYYGSRVYPTEVFEFIHPVNNDYNGYGNFYGSDIGGAKNTSYTGAITTMSPSGELRQTYHDRQYSLGYNSNSLNAPNKVVYRDFQLYEGFLTMQTQKVGWSPTQHGTDNDDYSALYMSGSGIAFVGNPNRFSPEKWMYRYSGYEGVKAGGSVLSFWGEVSHEDLVENNFDMSLGTGITMDVFGNINAMVGSTDWRVRSFMGKPVLNISMNYGNSGFGSVLYSNIPGMSSGAYDNRDGSADAINLEEQGGHIVMGRLWLNTFGVDNYDDNSNNNVHFHLRSNHGWFFFHGETHGGPFVNDSQKELKYDIKPLSFKDSQDIIMNTDFASFKYKEQNNRTDRGHMGVVIDNDSTGYSVDPRILSEDDKGVDIMSVVAALGTLVKQQQKQISELNMHVAYLSTQLNK